MKNRYVIDVASLFCLIAVSLIAAGCASSVQSDYQPQLLHGHSDYVRALAISADNTRVFSLSQDGMIKVWSLSSGELLQSAQVNCRFAHCMAIAPDGGTLAVAGIDGDVVLLEPKSCAERRRLVGHGDEVLSVSFSHDAKWLASASKDGTIRIWDVGSGHPAHQIQCDPKQGSPALVAFSPKGDTLAYVLGGRVILLSVSGWAQLASFVGGDSDLGVYSMCFSPDGRTIATGTYTALNLWKVATGRLERRIQSHFGRVTAVAISPDGEFVASGGGVQHYDSRILLYDRSTGSTLASVAVHQMPVAALLFSSDGRWLVSGSWDQTVGIYDLAKMLPLRTTASAPRTNSCHGVGWPACAPVNASPVPLPAS